MRYIYVLVRVVFWRCDYKPCVRASARPKMPSISLVIIIRVHLAGYVCRLRIIISRTERGRPGTEATGIIEVLQIVNVSTYLFAYLSLGKGMVVIGAPFTLFSVHVSDTVPQSGPSLVNLRRHCPCAYARSSAKGMT